MKRRIVLLVWAFCLTALTLPAGAQSWVKKVSKSVFTLKTFDDQGKLVGSATGVFTSEQGEGLSCFEPFVGAARAVVIDAGGKEYEVQELLGANATYDVAKFKVAMKKAQPVMLATQNANEGDVAFVLPYREAKQSQEVNVNKVQLFNDIYAYYTLKDKGTASAGDCHGQPLFNAEGLLLGLMQKPMSETDTLNYAVSAVYADSLKMTGLSINDQTLRSTSVKKALPSELSQALLTIFVAASTLDSTAYAQLLDDFIVKFPDAQDGYINRAQFAASGGRYADADHDMEQALKMGGKSDEVHFAYSRMIYQKLLYRPEPAYEPWTYDKAAQEAVQAYTDNTQPAYRQQQAYVLFAQKKYAEASSIYETLFTSALRSPELFYEAARCKQMQQDSVAYLQLLDSAVAQFSRPYLKEAAPYILARAQAKIEAEKYREAVFDLNDYEQLMVAQVNDAFYYLRFKAEEGGRLFQQALDDIKRAIEMNPKESVYYAEKASLEVRVGLLDEAIQTADECIKVSPDYSDGYLFRGIALCLKDNKEEGVKNLLKAKELGDTQADALIEKYGK